MNIFPNNEVLSKSTVYRKQADKSHSLSHTIIGFNVFAYKFDKVNNLVFTTMPHYIDIVKSG